MDEQLADTILSSIDDITYQMHQSYAIKSDEDKSAAYKIGPNHAFDSN